MGADIGVTGLAVMGANLARNLARNGYTVALHNRTVGRTDALINSYSSEGTFVRTESLAQLVESLDRPRRVLIMVKAGAPVDSVIDELLPMLDAGDIVIDADRKSTRLNSSHVSISYAVFCLKKKNNTQGHP